MSHNPNTIESQSELSTTNDGKRSSEVLLSTIEELEKTKKDLKGALDLILLLSPKHEDWVMYNWGDLYK